MYSLLLRKALPFALTFVIGSLVGGLFKAVGIGGAGAWNSRAYFYRHGGRHSCDMRARQRYLVAESKPLMITFKPDAVVPAGFGALTWGRYSVTANVTFGADGRVLEVVPTVSELVGCPQAMKDAAARNAAPKPVWEAVERAARHIQFQPETVDGVPVTVTQDVEIRFMPQ